MVLLMDLKEIQWESSCLKVGPVISKSHVRVLR